MIKLLLLLLLSLDLFAQGTCYTVQLFSKTNSPENVLELKNKSFPDGCQTMTVSNFLTVRCGCYEGYSQAQKLLPSLKSISADAAIVTTNKSRFAKPKAVVAAQKKEIQKPQEQNSTKEPKKAEENLEINATQETLIVPTELNTSKEIKTEELILSPNELNTTLKPELKVVESLSDDELFHSDRESGLSIYEAINRAIEISPKINAAAQVVVQDREKLHEVEAGHLPVVDLSGDAGYEARQLKGDDKDTTATPVSTVLSRYKKADLYLTITENLWSGGSIENAIDEKDAMLKASLYDYRNKLENLVIDVANAYFDVVYGEVGLKISLKNMKQYEKILKIVTIKERNGAATTGDVNFIKANIDNARTELVQKQKALADAISKYEYLLETQDEAYLPYETESVLYEADLNTSLKTAHEFNAKILRQRAYIKATKFGFLATKKNFAPKVDFTINGESRNEFDVGLGQREKVNALVTFNYNLYHGGRDEATAVKLFAKMKEQKYLYDDIERNLVFDVTVLNQSLESLLKSLSLTESEVLAARKVVDSYWIAFQNGTQDLQALQLAQRNLNRAEQDYANYKKDLVLSNYSLMQNTGVLLKFLELPYKKNADEFKGDLNLFYELSDLK